MGHLIKLSDDRSKLATATNPDGFTSRAYLENILVDSLKSSRELGYGGCALDVTAQNLVHLMLRLELCFEDTTRSHGVGKLFIPTILHVGQAAGSWNWSPKNQNMNSTYFGRRLQCDDPICTFIPQGFFCQLQVVTIPSQLHWRKFVAKLVGSENLHPKSCRRLMQDRISCIVEGVHFKLI
jgi:hypothetical protein